MMWYLRIGALVLAFVVGFGSAWNWQGARKDAIRLEALQQTADAAAVAAALARAHKEARDKEYQTKREAEVKDSRIAQLEKEKRTKRRDDYLTQDSNARNCGLSVAGVRVWNDAASGTTVSGPEPTGPVDYGGPIAASNADVTRAAETSFDRHWDAIRQINGLRNYINTQCKRVTYVTQSEEKPNE